MTVTQHIDWPAVRMAFIEGQVDENGVRSWRSLRQLCDLLGVNPPRVYAMSRKEGWLAQRDEFIVDYERRRREKRARTLANHAVDLDAAAFEAAQAGLALATRRLVTMTKTLEIEEPQVTGSGDDPTRDEHGQFVKGHPRSAGRRSDEPWFAGDLDKLLAAADRAYALGLKAIGEPPTTRHEITGANGEPLASYDIREDLRRDDPDRLAKFFVAAERAGLVHVRDGSDGRADAIDARLVGDPPELGPAGDPEVPER